MSKTHTLKAEKREKAGTRAARALRGEGRIPACLLPDKDSPAVQIHIDGHGFMTARRHHVHLFEIELGGKIQTALVRELQWDTFGESVIHVDFKRVRADVETDTLVALEFVGHPKTGMLNHLYTEVTIRCIPAKIPDLIEVPVDHLEPGGSILAKELKLPVDVKLAIPPETVIAVAVLVKEVVEPTPAAEGAAVPAAGAAGAVPAAGAPGATGAPAAAPAKATGKEKEG